MDIIATVQKIFEEISKFVLFFTSGEFIKSALVLAISTITTILTVVFGWLPSIPSLPPDFEASMFQFFDFPFTSGAVGFIGWIYGSWTFPAIVFSSALAIYIFRVSFDFIILILSKFPFLGVSR